MIATASLDWLADCFDVFRPLPKIRMLDWCKEHIVNEHGRAYDHLAYPHLGAPGGPMDAIDDPRTREIVMQFGSRGGKTFVGECFLLKQAMQSPAPQMLVTPDEMLALEIIQRTYRMIHSRRKLNSLLVKCAERQKATLIEFKSCRQYVGWARSAARLADKDIRDGHGAELDLWTQYSTSKGGDPIEQFLERFKNHWSTRKIVLESVPTITGKSAVERRRLLGTNCQFHVPCRRCQRYQRIVFGGPTVPHGLKFYESNPDGTESTKFDPHYVCIHCGGRNENHERSWMMTRGVWIPEGCGCDDDVAMAITKGHEVYEWRGWSHAEWITGQPVRDCERASYQWSSLCALSLTWTDIATKFLDVKDKPQALRNFINQWLGETWEESSHVVLPHEVEGRLGTTDPIRVCPDWTRFLTLAADVGLVGSDMIFYWMVSAWGLNQRGALLDYGVADGQTKFLEVLAGATYQFADGRSLRPCRIGVDSGDGHVSNAVYELCRPIRDAWPLKGSSGADFPDVYQLGFQRTDIPAAVLDARRKRGLGDLFIVNTNRSQGWIGNLLQGVTPRGDPAFYSLPMEAGGDLELCEQLTNEVGIRKDHRMLWKKTGPNEFRDTARYTWALAWHYTRNGQLWNRLPEVRRGGPVVTVRLVNEDHHHGLLTPGGQPFLITERG